MGWRWEVLGERVASDIGEVRWAGLVLTVGGKELARNRQDTFDDRLGITEGLMRLRDVDESW